MMDERLKAIADHYLLADQTIKAKEELAELSDEINILHWDYRSWWSCNDDEAIYIPSNRNELIGEIADVQIMIEQLIYLLNIEQKEIDKVREFKLNRQIERIRAENENTR